MSSNKRFLVERFRVRCFVECIDRSKYSSGSKMNTVIYLSYPHTASYFASRFDRWTNVSIQRIRCSRHENFSTYLWKKKNKERKRRRKTSVKGIWKIPSNFWIMKLRECTRTPASILLSAFYSLWDLWIRNF